MEVRTISVSTHGERIKALHVNFSATEGDAARAENRIHRAQRLIEFDSTTDR